MPPFSFRARRRRALAGDIVSTVLCALLLIGCGAAPDSESDSGIPEGYPTIASPDFQGTFRITGADIAGQPLDLGSAIDRLISFDVVTGAVTVDLGCDRRLGSFTLAEDGSASITLTGRIEVDPCPPSDLDDSLVDLIDRIERWEPAGSGFRLVAPGGDDVVLSGI